MPFVGVGVRWLCGFVAALSDRLLLAKASLNKTVCVCAMGSATVFIKPRGVIVMRWGENRSSYWVLIADTSWLLGARFDQCTLDELHQCAMLSEIVSCDADLLLTLYCLRQAGCTGIWYQFAVRHGLGI